MAQLEITKDHIKLIAKELYRMNLKDLRIKITKTKKSDIDKRTEPKKFFSVPEIQEITGLKPVTVRNHIKAGLIIASKTGRRWLVSKKNLDNYLNNQEV